MTTTRNRPGSASGAASETLAGVSDIVQPQPTAEQWSQLCQWHYELGLIEGYARGRADADAELVNAMARALGRPDDTDYGTALRMHERWSEQAKRRREWDAHASEPRPGDYPGRAAA